jgi:hypothetical protein
VKNDFPSLGGAALDTDLSLPALLSPLYVKKSFGAPTIAVDLADAIGAALPR